MYFDAYRLGNIISVRIMTDKESGRSKGYGKFTWDPFICVGFVSYDSPAAASMAIKVVNGKSVLGKKLKVELKKGGMPSLPTQLTTFDQTHGSVNSGGNQLKQDNVLKTILNYKGGKKSGGFENQEEIGNLNDIIYGEFSNLDEDSSMVKERIWGVQ